MFKNHSIFILLSVKYLMLLTLKWKLHNIKVSVTFNLKVLYNKTLQNCILFMYNRNKKEWSEIWPVSLIEENSGKYSRNLLWNSWLPKINWRYAIFENRTNHFNWNKFRWNCFCIVQTLCVTKTINGPPSMEKLARSRLQNGVLMDQL